ncbi:MAG: BMP family ABC transporter substrate-binding protein [Clostridia bacterium]|nr:BMP family ABC transporter substrate-binding protein [Clostridia bacterium]
MKKKVLALVLAISMVAALCIGLVACNTTPREVNLQAIEKENVKIGLIGLHDENSTYDLNFIKAMNEAVENLGLNKETQLVIKTNIPESERCYNAAVELVEAGCNIIFADSFGHEDYIMQAAWEYPNVRFCHATGTKAHTADYGNYYNAFASIYEGRYLAGIVAGYKLNEMIAAGTITAAQAKMGYVGAYTYAEVISGYTSFYLGAKSVCPSVTMDVRFTGSWYDVTAEKETAKTLIEGGCVLISQHADSMGAPTACKEAGVPNVTYNVSTKAEVGDTYLVYSRINWAPYYEYVINSAIANDEIAYDWTGTLATGSVEVGDFGTKVSAETIAAVNEAKAKLIAGTLNVFDTANFKVNGEKVTTYLADVDTDENFQGDTEAIVNGIFKESFHRSAPYFALQIDGITLLNSKF